MWRVELASPFWTPVVPSGLSGQGQTHNRHGDIGHWAEQVGSLPVVHTLHLPGLLGANYHVSAKA